VPCHLWDWRAANGRAKDVACRSLLRKLDQRGLIELPPRQSHPRWVLSSTRTIAEVEHPQNPIASPLATVLPVEVAPVSCPGEQALFECLFSRYHCLAFHRTVGENMKYLAYDRQGRS